MKSVDCDIIQDLLPSYSDKLSSNSTNILVEEHLKECENCKKILEGMNKYIKTSPINSQKEEIDYLKGYRKYKLISIIFAIVLTTVIIILFGFIIPYCFRDTHFFVSADEFNVEYIHKYRDRENNEDKIALYIYSDKHKYIYTEQHRIINTETGKSEILIKVSAQNSRYADKSYSGSEEYINIKDIDRICIQDLKNNRREIWNKDMETQSEEEWWHWYIDSYAPEEVKKYYSLSYDRVLHAITGYWRHKQ